VRSYARGFKGQCGNPLGGAILKKRTEAQQARYAEIQRELESEFPKATFLERLLIGQCADLFERAERRSPRGDDQATRLASAAVRHHREPKTIKRIAAAAGVSIKPRGGPDCRLGAILMGYRTGTRVAVDLTPNERRAQLIVRLRAKHGPRARGWFRNRQIGGAMG